MTLARTKHYKTLALYAIEEYDRTIDNINVYKEQIYQAMESYKNIYEEHPLEYKTSLKAMKFRLAETEIIVEAPNSDEIDKLREIAANNNNSSWQKPQIAKYRVYSDGGTYSVQSQSAKSCHWSDISGGSDITSFGDAYKLMLVQAYAKMKNPLTMDFIRITNNNERKYSVGSMTISYDSGRMSGHTGNGWSATYNITLDNREVSDYIDNTLTAWHTANLAAVEELANT
jgi:hypothetical protein